LRVALFSVTYLLPNLSTDGDELLHADACRPWAGPLLSVMWIEVIVGKKMNIVKLCLHFCCCGWTAAAICCYL